MKALIVVDIPNDLKYEELYFNGEIRYTSEFDRGYVFLKEINRGLLKPLPQKQEQKDEAVYQFSDYKEGWNDCIDEVLKEAE